MASLKKRGKYYSIVFKTHIDGNQVLKTYALGTKYKKVAEHKKTEYEKLYQSGQINPFDDNWNLKEYEQSQEAKANPSVNKSYFLDEIREEFLLTKEHMSKHTYRAYKSITKLFIESVGKTMPVDKINHKDIRTFCFNNEHSNATKRNYLRHLKAFFNWLKDESYIETSPCENISPPKKQEQLVDKIIDENELKLIFDKFDEYQADQQKKGHIKDDTQKQHWFKPLITMAFYTGMRRSELLQQKWEDINFEVGMLVVTKTKNGKERTVTIFDQVYYTLKEWREFNGNPDRGLVFPSPRSTDKLEINLAADNVSKVFKENARRAEMKPAVNFHSLRHSNITYRLKKDFGVTIVKEEVGHKSIEVTMGYVHLVSKDRRDKAKEKGHITYL